MISESYYWKSDLLKHAAALQRRIGQKRWSDVSVARCEQTIMLGAYSIRRLRESAKLTDKVANMSVGIKVYKSNGSKVHRLNSHRLEELYGLEKGTKRTVSLPALCNRIIHSYIFCVLLGECGGLEGILVASDRERSKELTEVPIPSLIKAFESVGNDEVNVIEAVFDAKGGDYVYRLARE